MLIARRGASCFTIVDMAFGCASHKKLRYSDGAETWLETSHVFLDQLSRPHLCTSSSLNLQMKTYPSFDVAPASSTGSSTGSGGTGGLGGENVY